MRTFSAPKKVKRLIIILIISACLVISAAVGYSLRLFGYNVPSWKNIAHFIGISSDNIELDSAEFWYLKVGQGNCSIIVLNELCIMVDCGPEDSFGEIASFMILKEIDNVDYLIITHPHNDHIGGAAKVIDRYNVKEMFVSDEFVPKSDGDSDAYDKMMFSAKLKDVKITSVSNGMKRNIVPFEFTFYRPSGNGISDENDLSTVILVSVYGRRALYPGDIGFASEAFLVQNKCDIDTDILCVPHHGSKYSTSKTFVEKTTPLYSVVCVGKNIYGHPNDGVVMRLKNSGSKMFRTDDNTVCIGIDQFGEIGSKVLYKR